MRTALRFRIFAFALAAAFALAPSGAGSLALAQSRRTPPTQPQKKNQRPGQETTAGEDGQKEELPPDLIRQKPTEDEIVRVTANLVNVDAVVYHKKTRQLVGNLTQSNFGLFEDGVQVPITNFSTPEAKLNVAVVIEFSKLTEGLGLAQTGGWDYGTREVIAPAAIFMQDSVRRGDYLSVVAFDMRPTPLTDFTNDPSRVSAVINLLLRNQPAFRETNLFDALKFTLVGGVGDSVVLEDGAASRKAEYAGLVAVQGRRRAVLLIASGIDTFSKINYDNARKIAQNAGIPIYIIGTGNMFYKRYEHMLGATDGLLGQPGRMTFQQAANALKTFASETGGAYFPVTFESEAPSAIQSINALMRHQYSLGYNPGDRRDGKRHKIEVRVDVNGDGVWDDKEYEINHRRFYVAPKADGKS